MGLYKDPDFCAGRPVIILLCAVWSSVCLFFEYSTVQFILTESLYFLYKFTTHVMQYKQALCICLTFVDESLHPWPRPMAIWPLNFQFVPKDLKPGVAVNDGEIYDANWRMGPHGCEKGSYELKGVASSYFEINNADKGAGPLNSFTFSMWLYPTVE